MNKKKLAVVIILIVVVVIILGVLAFHNRAKAPVAVNSATSSTTASAATSTGVTAQASSTGSSTVSVVPATSTRQFYANNAFSFSYPAAWSIATYVPFSITNFGNKYTSGGAIPAGGALIIITTSTIEQGYLQSMINSQLMNATNITTTTLMVSGVACPAVTFEAAYAAGATSKNVSVYCVRGSELWEIYFSYGANDPAATTRVAELNGMLGSMKFLP